MPYENEHSCRKTAPDKYDKFRRGTRKHKGKEYSIIFGKIKDKDKWEDQAYRYDKDTWTASEAKTHCKDHDGTFEPASETEIVPVEEGLFVCTVPNESTKEFIEDIRKEISLQLPEGSKLIVLTEGMTLKYIKVGGVSEFELVPVEIEKAGAVLNKSNKAKLGKAISLVQEVIDSSEKESTSDNPDDKGIKKELSVITLTEDKLKSKSQEKINLPVSKDEVKMLVETAIKESLGKLT